MHNEKLTPAAEKIARLVELADQREANLREAARLGQELRADFPSLQIPSRLDPSCLNPVWCREEVMRRVMRKK